MNHLYNLATYQSKDGVCIAYMVAQTSFCLSYMQFGSSSFSTFVRDEISNGYMGIMDPAGEKATPQNLVFFYYTSNTEL